MYFIPCKLLMIFFLGYGTKINALEFLRMVNALNLKK